MLSMVSIIEFSSLTGDGTNCRIQTSISFIGVIQAICVGMDLLLSISFRNKIDPLSGFTGQLTIISELTNVEMILILVSFAFFDDARRVEQMDESRNA